MNSCIQELTEISRLQQRAKQLKLHRGLTDNQALNLAAHEHGFSDYQTYLEAVRKQAIQMMLYQNRQTHRLSS